MYSSNFVFKQVVSSNFSAFSFLFEQANEPGSNRKKLTHHIIRRAQQTRGLARFRGGMQQRASWCCIWRHTT
jgi:hypothetical protein